MKYMESINLIQELQKNYKGKLLLTGLAAIQSPIVHTKQLTFFNPTAGKENYFIGSHHILIRRTTRKSLTMVDHLLFIAKHIELYADEIDQLITILPDIVLSDIEQNDRAWRIFAYLKKHFLNESVPAKKSIGRRTIDIGDITSVWTIRDPELHVRDALLISTYRARATIWMPHIKQHPDHTVIDKKCCESGEYFKARSIRPLFHKFCRYANRLESAASAKIEGYNANVDAIMLTNRLQKKIKVNLALRANLNMDNLHKSIIALSSEPLSTELLCHLQKAIVWETWQNKEDMIDKTPGILRPFDEVIVERSKVQENNIIYVAPKHEDVAELLRELIDFYHRTRGSMHPLDLASIVKCQLVVIHPFGDGNGRLARWCFQSILIREKYIESIHQAPISHIFLEEKNRYYNELAQVDRPIMKKVSYELDRSSHRYRAIYDDVNVYRDLDYSSWLSYSHGAFERALVFSMEEHEIFERTERIFEKFEKFRKESLSTGQKHEILRAIDIGLRYKWGRKTEKRLLNNGLSNDEISHLKILAHEKVR